jgi:hypothetical protein
MVSNRARRYRIMGGMIVCVFLLLPRMAGSQQPTIADRMGARHWSGQGMSPVFEGFDLNPDGTYNLWFGYMNLNWEEQFDLPIGPDNIFEPGAPDRGQPTHFAERRHKDVFRVIVPANFGNEKLVWKLTVRGKTESIYGTLNPVWQIDRRRTTRGGNDDAVDSNTPPVASVQPPEQTIGAGAKASLAISATDDGLPKRIRTSFPAPNGKDIPPQLYAVPLSAGRGAGGAAAGGVAAGGGGRGAGGAAAAGSGGRGAGAGAPAEGNGGSLSYEWFKYRGPGSVTFTQPRGILPASGKTTSTASFSEPGDYMLQVVIDDGSGESAGNFGYHCCWTNVEAKVHVTK